MVLTSVRQEVTDIVLVSGDADMIPGVQEAVNHGIRVHLYGFGWDSMSSALRHACDSLVILDPREDFGDCMQLHVLEGPLPPIVRTVDDPLDDEETKVVAIEVETTEPEPDTPAEQVDPEFSEPELDDINTITVSHTTMETLTDNSHSIRQTGQISLTMSSEGKTAETPSAASDGKAKPSPADAPTRRPNPSMMAPRRKPPPPFEPASSTTEASKATVGSSSTILVIGCTFLIVTQSLIGFLNFLVLFLSTRLLVDIWVVFFGKLTISLFDLVCRSVF